jgi:hypothetical protein
MVYEFTTLDQLSHAIIASPWSPCPTQEDIASISDASQRREQHLLVKYYCDDVIKLCRAADPAIGQPLVELINEHETLLISTEQRTMEDTLYVFHDSTSHSAMLAQMTREADAIPEEVHPSSPAPSTDSASWSPQLEITGYSSDSDSDTSEPPIAPQTPDQGAPPRALCYWITSYSSPDGHL